MTSNNKLLTVYRASAGSGKTFTLAVKYIELLIERPENYRSILAVTFTNKATNEMKLRILSQLYGLAKGLPDSEDYARAIENSFRSRGKTVSRKQIMTNAAVALRYLLHNYNYFRIQTIDAFFQQVTRNMAKELNLNANFKLSLNDRQVEEKAVDEMIEQLLPKSDVMKWILDYISDNISQDLSWNVIGAIKEFGLTIYKDVYKEHEDELNRIFSNPTFFKDFETKMRSIMSKSEKFYTEVYSSFCETLSSHGVEISDFKNGSRGACGYFIKYGKGIREMSRKKDDDHFNKTAQNACESTSAWVKKQDVGTSVEQAAEALRKLMNEAEDKRKEYLGNYKSAAKTIEHISKLRLLGSISDKVDEANALANRFPLSATQMLLNSMIGNSDAPFVYEKIGTQIRHIMIDEFQDTSIAQWKNFKVLLNDCLAQRTTSLIVGDVKQSIYRWRNSDWRLLNGISKEFSDKEIGQTTLDTNYRSEANIINFNNVFFEKAAAIEFGELNDRFPGIGEIYSGSNIIQKIPDDKRRQPRGYVEIALLDKQDYRDNTLARTADIVKDLLARGVRQKSIAILTRTNSNITTVGEYLMNELPSVNLVSDEAFVLGASLAVNTIITAMRVLSNEGDLLAKATLARYALLLGGHEDTATDIFRNIGNLDALLPKAFCKAERQLLLTKPVYELAETIYSIFGLASVREETAYVCKFFDTLATFLSDYPATLKDVLREWDENMCSKAIESDDVEGIRLITIHKSKGLEYDNVIIPFCDWPLERGGIIWLSPGVAPYNELPLAPIEFSKTGLEGTIYEADYEAEHVQNLVDNMNLLYVAFTRAGKNLFVIGKKTSSTTSQNTSIRSAILEAVLPNLTESVTLAGGTIEEEKDEAISNLVYRLGDICIADKKEEHASDNVFKTQHKLTSLADTGIGYHPDARAVQFRQSNKSREFVGNQEKPEEEQAAYIQTGTLLHYIFSTISTLDDIDKALTMLEQEGELYPASLSKEKLMTMLQKRLESPKVREWFSPRWQLFNECEILSLDPVTGKMVTHRPDRVMTDGQETVVVDFKFAAPQEEHKRQVSTYMTLLRQMGNSNVRGYLWYVYSNRIVEIEAETI